MERNETNYMMFACIFVAALVTSNVLASKVVQVGPLEVPAAIVAYPFTFLMTDIIGELWGKKHAQKVVYVGIICQIISVVMICCAVYLPAVSYMNALGDEFEDVLGTTLRIVFASMLGFIASQTCDVFIFHRLKEKFFTHKWIRNNISTICSQVVDSTIFILVAFGGMGMDLGVMIASQIFIKWIIALCDTPLFYLLTKGSAKQSEHI